MKFQPGQSVRGNSGRKYRVERFLGAGTQGGVYRATDSNGAVCVVKSFRKRFHTKSLEQRLQRLVQLNLQKLCPTLIGPTDVIAAADGVGHVSSLAEGKPLDTALADGSILPQQALQIAAALTHSLVVLEDNDLAHGDLQTGHVLVSQDGDHHRIAIIDFDNFVADGVPEPDCLGASLYMAPEIRNGKQRPDVFSDRFALTGILHELLLLRHLTSGLLPDDDKADPQKVAAEYEKVMMSGVWMHDPALADAKLRNAGGHSSHLLNTEIAGLFRRGVRIDPDERPSPHEWRARLLQALYQVVACPNCGYQNISDTSKKFCPDCRKPYPVLAIAGPFGRIVLDRASVTIGRDDIKDDTVSQKHVVIHRKGPDYWITDRSRNGTSRSTPAGDWKAFEKRKSILIADGDRLRFGEVEVQVITAG